MKKAIATLSKSFPVTHQRAGENTEFEHKIEVGEKAHTIRKDAKGIWVKRFAKINAGEMYLDLRQWIGRPYNSKQRHLFKRTKEDGIGLQKITMTYGSDDAFPQVCIDGKQVPVQEVAKRDGLAVEYFVDWFFGSSKESTFEGVVIHFTDFRY